MESGSNYSSVALATATAALGQHPILPGLQTKTEGQGLSVDLREACPPREHGEQEQEEALRLLFQTGLFLTSWDLCPTQTKRSS